MAQRRVLLALLSSAVLGSCFLAPSVHSATAPRSASQAGAAFRSSSIHTNSAAKFASFSLLSLAALAAQMRSSSNNSRDSGGREHIKKCAVVHSTAYDGAIERACINLGVPVMSDELKKQVGFKAVDDYVKSGTVIGLGTGSTAAFAVERVGEKLKSGELKDIIAIPTSIRTKEQAEGLGIPLATLDTHSDLDVAIDGADEERRSGDKRLSLLTTALNSGPSSELGQGRRRRALPGKDRRDVCKEVYCDCGRVQALHVLHRHFEEVCGRQRLRLHRELGWFR
eukprot:g10148.t1